MNDTKNWTIRTRNLITGSYHDASFFEMTLVSAKRFALGDRPNSEVVGVWPHVWSELRTADEVALRFKSPSAPL